MIIYTAGFGPAYQCRLHIYASDEIVLIYKMKIPSLLIIPIPHNSRSQENADFFVGHTTATSVGQMLMLTLTHLPKLRSKFHQKYG